MVSKLVSFTATREAQIDTVYLPIRSISIWIHDCGYWSSQAVSQPELLNLIARMGTVCCKAQVSVSGEASPKVATNTEGKKVHLTQLCVLPGPVQDSKPYLENSANLTLRWPVSFNGTWIHCKPKICKMRVSSDNFNLWNKDIFW